MKWCYSLQGFGQPVVSEICALPCWKPQDVKQVWCRGAHVRKADQRKKDSSAMDRWHHVGICTLDNLFLH